MSSFLTFSFDRPQNDHKNMNVRRMVSSYCRNWI